jgi:hypothetical protein
LKGCSKEGQDRPLLSESTLEQTLASNIQGEILREADHVNKIGTDFDCDGNKRTGSFIELDTLDKFKTHCDDAKNHEFHSKTGNRLSFKRLNPSHCDICKRTHDKDNTV